MDKEYKRLIRSKEISMFWLGNFWGLSLMILLMSWMFLLRCPSFFFEHILSLFLASFLAVGAVLGYRCWGIRLDKKIRELEK